MRKRFRLYQRGNVFYCQDNENGKQESLWTSERAAALRILEAKNEACQLSSLNLQIARVHLEASDPDIGKRTWQIVLDEILKTKAGETKARWERAAKSKALEPLRNLPLIETRPEHFLRVLQGAGVSANVYLRRLQNWALEMGWLIKPVVPKKQWPKIRYKEKRAITLDEHQKIIGIEWDSERKAFYEILWHLGGSQSDIAGLKAEDIDWEQKLIIYARRKTGQMAFIHFSDQVEKILRSLPSSGLLFPRISEMHEKHRAAEFARRCRRLKIEGISLHSYRYAFAERAAALGYPERFAQFALGHNSAAVHRAYAKKAKVLIPSLEEYEQMRKVHLPAS